MAANKLIYSWNQNNPIPSDKLSSYAESLIFDGERRTLWHKGHQYGNTYYGSEHGEYFNDFKNNTASGKFSHAEGTFTTASGVASHAEGYKSHAAGNYTTVSGLYTQAYNNTEAAFGKYNKSNIGTVFSIGDGISDNERHNIIEVTNSYTYISNKSYLGDYLFAPLSYSYVDYTGADKPMNLIVKALLQESEYTKPTLYTKFVKDDNIDLSSFSPSYISKDTTRITIEIGSYFRPGIYIYWPDTDDDVMLASRMREEDQHPDYKTIPSYRTGYSYGLTDTDPIRFICDGKQVVSNIINEPIIVDTYTYINNETDYDIINSISLSYKQSSYMLYEQLKRVGLYQMSYGYDRPYFSQGTVVLSNRLIVEGRYLWYAGLSNSVPASKDEMLVGSTGFLDKMDDFTTYSYCGYKVNEQDISNEYFWLACPENFELTKYNPRYTVNLCRGNAINYDLTTDAETVNNKKINTSSIELSLGMNNTTKRYIIYYIKLNAAQLADGENDVIRFKFGLRVPDTNIKYILTEGGDNEGKALETEDSSGNILYEGIEYSAV